MFTSWLQKTYPDLALLMLRLSVGLFLAFGHGLGKLTSFGEYFHSFSDPIGLGPEISYLLTVSAEFFCALAVALGIFTRLSCIPVLILFAVIFFVVHSDDPISKKEIVVLFFSGYLTIFLAGPGRYTLDRVLFKR